MREIRIRVASAMLLGFCCPPPPLFFFFPPDEEDAAAADPDGVVIYLPIQNFFLSVSVVESLELFSSSSTSYQRSSYLGVLFSFGRDLINFARGKRKRRLDFTTTGLGTRLDSGPV